MAVIITKNREQLIETLKKLGDDVFLVTQEVIYALPPTLKVNEAHKFLERFKESTTGFNYYKTGKPTVIGVKKL